MSWGDEQAAEAELKEWWRGQFATMFAAATTSNGGIAYMELQEAYVEALARARRAEEAQRMAEADCKIWQRDYDALSQRYLQLRGMA